MMKLFYPEEFFDASVRPSWTELLKSKDRFERGSKTADDLTMSAEITWVSNIDDADILVVPMDWSYYYERKNQQKVLDWANAHKGKMPVVSQSGGDHGITIPEGIWQFRSNIYASKNNRYQVAVPPFFPDPLTAIFQQTEFTARPYNEVPVIGFCGQSISTPSKRMKDILRVLFLNTLNALGLNYWDKHEVMSTSHLREKVLRIIERSELRPNFIRRVKYRAGANTPEQRNKTTLEYFENQRDSDYIICVRGGGNFSVRFYETLAMGRIPVFVNTDCKLPFATSMEWEKHVVWIEENELNEMPQKISAFHKKLGADGFKALQQHNRKLWQANLTLGSFYPQALKEILAERGV
ncbi:MAG: exostosin domain-containing protein [Flavipsychrobacter sp.]